MRRSSAMNRPRAIDVDVIPAAIEERLAREVEGTHMRMRCTTALSTAPTGVCIELGEESPRRSCRALALIRPRQSPSGAVVTALADTSSFLISRVSTLTASPSVFTSVMTRRCPPNSTWAFEVEAARTRLRQARSWLLRWPCTWHPAGAGHVQFGERRIDRVVICAGALPELLRRHRHQSLRHARDAGMGDQHLLTSRKRY